MSNHTYRVIEIVGTSPDGVDAAIQRAVWPELRRPCARWTGSKYSQFEATWSTERSRTSR